MAEVIHDQRSFRVSYDCSNRKYDLDIIINVGIKVGRYTDKTIRFKVDTGASKVCLPAKLLGVDDEQTLIKIFPEYKISYHTGIDRTSKIKFYDVYVDELRIGNSGYIVKGVPVSISLDPKYRVPLLGMTLLRMFFVSINPIMHTIDFKETGIMEMYRQRNLPLYENLYKRREDLSEDMQVLEANYINTQLSLDG